MFSFDQYDAARKSAIVLDRSSQGKLGFAGSDRASFLHGLLTNDIAGIRKGHGVYAAYLTAQGRMISDMRVIETGDRMLLDVEGRLGGALAARFDKLIFSEDVQVYDLSADLAEFGVHGPAAALVLERATGLLAARLVSQYENLTSQGVIIVRDDSLGLSGFDCYVERAHADELRAKLVAAGAKPSSEATAEVLRIEAGRPRFGVDMDTETIPLEAGIEDRAISLTKGCYVGQEVIVRVLHRGHGRVARRLVGIVLPAGSPPSAGDPILAANQQVGAVTSGAASPLMGTPIALGYVQRDHANPGSEVLVGNQTARVHRLPFSRG